MPLVMIQGDKRAREKPCLRCGYSLRRIESTHCPECGLSVWRSLNANDELDWSHPNWLSRISIACWVLMSAQIFGLAGYAIANFIWLAPVIRNPNLFDLWFRGWPYIPFLAAAYELIMAAGLLLLADEERRYPDKWKPYRWACRIVAALMVIAAIASLVIGLTGHRQFLAFGFTEIALNVSIIAATIATVAYLRALAKRIPSSRAARLCAWMMLAPAISLLKAFPLYSLFMMLDFGGVIISWLPMIFVPVIAGMLFWFARSFKRAARAAHQGWEAETAQAGMVS